jgi:hypothetical protein
LNLYLTIKIIFLDFQSKITDEKSETYYYMVKTNFLESMKNICFEWRIEPFLYYNIEKFFQVYEISKQFDFNYITPFNYKRSIFFHQSAPPAPGKQKQYLSIFVRFLTKKYNLVLKINMNKLHTIVKYGWTMFSICSDDYMDLPQYGQYAQPRNRMRYTLVFM